MEKFQVIQDSFGREEEEEEEKNWGHQTGQCTNFMTT